MGSVSCDLAIAGEEFLRPCPTCFWRPVLRHTVLWGDVGDRTVIGHLLAEVILEWVTVRYLSEHLLQRCFGS